MAQKKVQKHTMEITISPDGNKVSVHVQGIKGKTCVDATEFLEKDLGLVKERTFTNEYRKTDTTDVVNVGHVGNK